MTKVATVTLNVDAKGDPKATNADKMCSYIDKAADQGAELVCFPESAVYGFGCSSVEELIGVFGPEEMEKYWLQCEPVEGGATFEAISAKAKEHNVYVIYNTYEKDELRPDIIRNTDYLVGPEGLVGRYYKVHLPGTEQLVAAMGGEFPVFDTRIGKIGMITCYDLAFPEAARALAVKGANIIVAPTGWPYAEQSEDDILYRQLRSFAWIRAMENGVFMITSNTAGLGSCGHSEIISPEGTILAVTGWEEEMVVADLGDISDAVALGRFRNCGGANYLKDRRPDAYMDIATISNTNQMNSSLLCASFNR